MINVGIVGSREYINENRVKAVLQKYIDKFGIENVTVVSGGCPSGGDALGKKLALELRLTYKEFPPVHRPHNQYCVLPESEYNKSYNVMNYFARNTKIAEYSDHVIAFVIKGVRCNGTMDTIKKAQRLGKKILVLED